MIRDLEIELLRTFITVAQCRNFTGAGTRLCLTQSAISAQIRRLEERTGKRLLKRSSKSVTLTDAGEELYFYAEKIIAMNDEALRKLSDENLSGTIKIGMHDEYATYYLPRVLAGFGKIYPGIQLEITCDLSVNLKKEVEQGKLDLALLTRQPNTPGGELVRKEPLVWVEARGSSLEKEDPLPLALFPSGSCIFREAAIEALNSSGKNWRIIFTSRSLAGIRASVSAGLAVSVTTLHSMSPDMRILENVQGFPKLPEINIALHKSNPELSPHAKLLEDYILSSFSDMDMVGG